MKSRTVSDIVWVLAAAVLLPVIIIEASVLGWGNLFNNIVAGILMFLVTCICFYFKLFGGADCKAFTLIALFFPPALYPPSSTAADFSHSIYSLSIHSLPIYSLSIHSLPIYSLSIHSLPIYSLSIHSLPVYSFLFDLISSVPVSTFMNSLIAAAVFSVFRPFWGFKPGSISFTKWLQLEIPFMLPLFIGFIAAILFGNSVFKILSFIFILILRGDL